MTQIDDAPSLGEQYEVQIGTKNMRISELHGSADLVLGAGLVPAEHRFGMLLYRLRAEYAGVSSSLRLAEAYSFERDRQAAALSKIRSDKPEKDGKNLAIALRRRAAGELLALRLLALSRIPSLPRVRQELGVMAVTLATRGWIRGGRRVQFMKNDAIACAIAGRVLDVFLDPVCHFCGGTKSRGSEYHSERIAPCNPCMSSGSRAVVTNDDAEAEFARELEAEMNRALSFAESALRLTKRDTCYTAPMRAS